MKAKLKKAIILLILCAISTSILIFSIKTVKAEENQTDMKLNVETNLEKYINYDISENDKGTLVQININTQIAYGEEKKHIPFKETETTISLSQIEEKYPNNIKVIEKRTEITNGKVSNKEANYEYDKNIGKLTIKASNINENGELIYSGKPQESAKDEYIIMCYYDTFSTENPSRDININVTSKAILNTEENKEIITEQKLEENVSENIGDMTSIKYDTEEIYNGNIKSNIINKTEYGTLYKEKEEILISKKEAQDKLRIEEDNSFLKVYKNEEEENEKEIGNKNNLVYKSTKFSKDNLNQTLGEDGKVEILDKNNNILFTIDKNSNFEEDGTITINYQEDIEKIILKTSNILNEGILEIENTKEIKSTMLESENIRIKTTSEIEGVKEEKIAVEVTEEGQKEEVKEKTAFLNKTENIVDIKEAKTDVKLDINNTKWTNKEQNEVDFNIYLNSENIQKNMFKNPTIKINLPEQVEKVILKDTSILYGNGLELEQPYIEKDENGKISIIATLTGKQTNYATNDIGLKTNITLSATIILKKDIENINSKLNLSYTNEYITSGDKEEGKISKEILIENYTLSEEQKETEEKVENSKSLEKNEKQENIEGLKLEVVSQKGSKTLESEDIVYEGEFIKYNIKITNTSEATINDVKIVGKIAEGTTYGELDADYYSIGGKYEYVFDEALKEKIINVGSLEPGESYKTFYEVKVNNLQDNEKDKIIKTNINAYIGEILNSNYEVNYIANKAEVKIFVKAYQDGIKNRWDYRVIIDSVIDSELPLSLNIPKGFELSYVARDGYKLDDDKINQTEENTIKISANKGEYVFGGVISASNLEEITEESKVELKAYAKININNKVYNSNEARIIYEYDNIEITMESKNEGEKVKYDEQIEYNIKLNNIGNTNSEESFSTTLKLKDYLPENIKPISVKYETYELEIKEDEESNTSEEIYTKKEKEEKIYTQWDEDGNKLPEIDLYITIPYGKSSNVTIVATAGMVYEETLIENYATIEGEYIAFKASNKITHTILPYNYEETEEPDKPVEPEEPDKPVEPEEPDKPVEPVKPDKKYTLTGKAWLDENGDGQRQTTEKGISNISVMLVSVENEITIKKRTTTDTKGEYIFNDISNGKFIVVFLYDTEKYNITQYNKNGVSENNNSDASNQKVKIQEKEINAGVTDIIEINNNVSNIDIGLIENKKCDLKLDKYISKVIVQTVNGTKTKNYNNTKLAKTEIKPKEIESATVFVEYKIIITNEGEIASKVDEVLDYLPEGLEFSKEKNPDWIIKNKNNLTNLKLTNRNIQPGEHIELKLTLTKKMNSSSMGSYINKAEIGKMSNTKNNQDIDSIPNNKNTSEDDYSEAELIISIGTGKVIQYTFLILLGITILGIGIFLIKKYGTNKMAKNILMIVIFTILIFSTMEKTFAEPIAPEYQGFISSGIDQVGTPFYNRDLWENNQLYQAVVGSTNCIEDNVICKYFYYDEYGNPINYVGKYTYLRLEDGTTTSSTKDTSKFSITNNKDDIIKMKKIGDNYIYGPFKIQATNYNEGYKIDVKDGLGRTISNVLICNSNGENISIKGTSEFYLKISEAACINGISSISAYAEKRGTKTTTTETTGFAIYQPTYNDGQKCKTQSKVKRIKTSTPESTTTKNTVLWTKFNSCLDIIKVDADNTNQSLANVTIQVTGPSYNQTHITDSDGKIHIDNLLAGKYTLKEISNPNYGYTQLINVDVPIRGGAVEKYTMPNTKNTGNLKITKKDADFGKYLSGISFKILDSKGNYIIAVDQNKVEQKKVTGAIHLGNLKTTTRESDATEFITDSNGLIQIDNILTGTYKVKEISVGNNEQYEIDDEYIYWESNKGNGTGHIATVQVERQGSYETTEKSNTKLTSDKNSKLTVYNRRKYVDLSGIVWEDIGDGKQTYKNNLYDSKEPLIEGMTVTLYEQDKAVRNTTTDINGKYIFKNVEIDKFSKYYISFKYNGMNYECVPKMLEQKNGSKATEGEKREIFNNKFVEIKNGEAIGISGEKTPIEYNKKDGKYESIVDLGKEEKDGKKPYYGVYEKYEITSTTYNAYNGYLDKIKTAEEIRKQDIKEVTDINLGIFLREQPNASLIKDLNNVKVSINGQTHTYNYRERFNNAKVYTGGKELKDLEQQIKFQGKYSEMTYTRPLYASDIVYEGTNELTVKVIYEIGIINKSTNLKMKIPQVYDYFDSKYELRAIGKTLDKNGYVNNDTSIGRKEISNKNNYKGIEISTNMILEPQKEEKIYIELEILKNEIVNLLDINTEIKLDNVAEIGRYGTLDSNGNIYGGIDSNSEPGNTNPANEKTYEDDTDRAPGFSLILQENPRKVTGKVFLENIETSKDPTTVMTGEERKGNGQYDNSEKGVKDVEVKLVYAKNPKEVAKVYDEETKTNTKDAIVKTNENGDFEISGFIPEEYEIIYTWGNKEYSVQNYKGTVIDESIWNKNEQNNEWYRTTEPRYSDAIDDYEIRKRIDKQTEKINNANMNIINNYVEGSKITLKDGTEEELITKMNSNTQDFKTYIEYNKDSSNVKEEFEINPDGSLKLDSQGHLISKDEFKNTIKNIDYGLVERPKQQINLEKHVKEVKITLANGVILVDAKIEKGTDGKYQLVEKTPYTIYLPKSNVSEGAVKIEIDQELVEGAKIDVTYEISINNVSELDYISEKYYKFGIGKENPVKLKASIIDYLDDNLIMTDKETTDKWNKLTSEEKKKLFENGSLDKNLKDYVEKLRSVQAHINEKQLKAGEQTKVELETSKLLSKNDEIIIGNKTEVIEIDKTGGKPPEPIPGNFNPTTNEPKEADNDTSEEIIILPPTGTVNNTKTYIMLGISSLGILTAGIILIKRFVLRNNN